MTATTLTHLAASDHLNQLRRHAQRNSAAAGLRPRPRFRLARPRPFARRAARAAMA